MIGTQLPISRGGLAIPILIVYYYTAMLENMAQSPLD